MDEDVLGLCARHQLASRCGDGLKPELLDHLSIAHAHLLAANVVDGAALFLRRSVEKQAPREPGSTVSIPPTTGSGVGAAFDCSLPARAEAKQMEAEA